MRERLLLFALGRANAARECGTQRSFLDACVQSAKPPHEKPTVTIEPGETLAADGHMGIMLERFGGRRVAIAAIEQEDTHVPTGLQFFKCVRARLLSLYGDRR